MQLSASPHEKPLILAWGKKFINESIHWRRTFYRERWWIDVSCVKLWTSCNGGKRPYFIEHCGCDWPSLMGIISAHWLRWVATLGRSASHWDRSGALPALCQHRHQWNRNISMAASVATFSRTKFTRRSRPSPPRCGCVCLRMCVCARMPAHLSISGCLWRGFLFSFEFPIQARE